MTQTPTLDADPGDAPAGDGLNRDEKKALTPDEQYRTDQAKYLKDKAQWDQEQAELRDLAPAADGALEVGDVVWVVLGKDPNLTPHPATAMERHPVRGWAFNVQYPGRVVVFRDVPFCGKFWKVGQWCEKGTIQKADFIRKEPTPPVPPLAVRMVYWLMAVRPTGGTIDDAIREGKLNWVGEFTDPDAAAAHWPGSTQAREGLIGMVVRRTLNAPAAPVERLWDSLHGGYEKPIRFTLPKG